MVLVRLRCAEQRHDPVAHHLVDRALVAVDRFDHAFQDRVKNLASFFGVPVGEQLHRALQVGEEDGDLLALPFQGRLGAEGLLREVLGGVGLRRCESCRLGPGSAGRLPAFQAELGTCRQLGAALDTRGGELGSALQTELRLRWVLVLAPGIPHSGPPSAPLPSPARFHR